MKAKIALSFYSLILTVSFVAAGNVSPVQTRYPDNSGYTENDLTFRRGESATVILVYTNVSFTTNSDTYVFAWSAGDLATNPPHSRVAGSITNATRAVIQVAPSNMPASGLYNWECLVENAATTTATARAFGAMEVNAGVVDGSTTNTPSFTPFDAALYTFLHASAGPWVYVVTNGIASGYVITWNGTNWVPTSAGAGDMLAATYDPAGIARGVVFTNDARVVFALTNGALYATAAQGAKADTAVQPTDAAYTNTAAKAASALQSFTESDPVFLAWLLTNNYVKVDTWSLVSNTVTGGAALGATAVQPGIKVSASTNADYAAVSGVASGLTAAVSNSFMQASETNAVTNVILKAGIAQGGVNGLSNLLAWSTSMIAPLPTNGDVVAWMSFTDSGSITQWSGNVYGAITGSLYIASETNLAGAYGTCIYTNLVMCSVWTGVPLNTAYSSGQRLLGVITTTSGSNLMQNVKGKTTGP